ncbi:glycosyltransferase family 39 protein, partial [bacterium]|nr:glycosyltransferase family 39 protein [bacterium]
MKKNWLEILILIVVVAAVTSPALRGGFISDDHKLIESRAPLFATSGAYRVLPLKMYFWGTAYDADVWHDYRPWVSLTYWFHYQLCGTNPFIYHLSNWILHIANTIFIFLLMRWFMGGGAALIVALLAGVCPAVLTSMGWISGRPDAWATFFVLLFLLAFRAVLHTRNSWPHIAAAAAFFMALASKETAIVAPAIAWALDRCANSVYDAREISQRRLWHCLVLLIPLGIYLPLRLAATGTMLPPVVKSFFTSLPFLAEQILRTIASVFLPLHYRFFTDVTWSLPGQRGAMFLFGWLVVLLLMALIAWGLKRRQLWAAGGLWALVALIPAFLLRRSGAPVMATYAYLALPGLWLMVVDGLRALVARVFPKTEARYLHFGFVPVVLVFAVLTFLRLPLLKNDLT